MTRENNENNNSAKKRKANTENGTEYGKASTDNNIEVVGEDFVGSGASRSTRVKKYNVVVIDKLFRCIAPLTFGLFCIIYAAYFSNYDANHPDHHED